MNEWLKQLAPLIGTALGGPLGGAAASFIADKLGLDTKDVKAVSDVLNSGKLTPEQISQVKLAEIDFQKFLESNKIKLEEIAAGDRNSAREMLKSTRSYVPATLTFGITIGYFVVLLGMMTKAFTVADSQVMLIMLGQLGTAWGVTIAFWFGTTSGSKDKTDILANSQPAK
jgi:gas vesicle protein